MGLPRRGEPDPDLIDGGLDELAWALLGVDGQLRANDLHQVGAGERGLVDLLGGRGQAAPIKRLP